MISRDSISTSLTMLAISSEPLLLSVDLVCIDPLTSPRRHISRSLVPCPPRSQASTATRLYSLLPQAGSTVSADFATLTPLTLVLVFARSWQRFFLHFREACRFRYNQDKPR